MKLEKQYTVASALDDNYVIPFLVMAYSANQNSEKKNFSFRIAHGEKLLSETNRILISRVLVNLNVTHDFVSLELDQNLKKERYISVTAFSRLFLADTMEDNFLWLDSDLICLPGWDQIFTDYTLSQQTNSICAVVDASTQRERMAHRNNTSNAAKIKMREAYFNSGVMLVNPKLWRQINISKSWKDVYRDYEALGFQFADQCILNYLCSNSIHHMARKYNTFGFRRGNFLGKGDVRIIHFAGGEKPWHYKKNILEIVLFSRLKASYVCKYMDYAENLTNFLDKNDFESSQVLRDMLVSFQRKKSFRDLYWTYKWLINQKIKILRK